MTGKYEQEISEIKLPKKLCGSCRFFSMGEDADAFCSLYNRQWEMSESECDQANCLKPTFCRGTEVRVKVRYRPLTS